MRIHFYAALASLQRQTCCCTRKYAHVLFLSCASLCLSLSLPLCAESSKLQRAELMNYHPRCARGCVRPFKMPCAANSAVCVSLFPPSISISYPLPCPPLLAFCSAQSVAHSNKRHVCHSPPVFTGLPCPCKPAQRSASLGCGFR